MVWLAFIKDMTATFWGDYGFSTLFVLGLVAILVLEKTKIRRYTYLWYTGLVLFFIYNPLTLVVCRQIMEDTTFDQYYLRFYSLAPVVFVIAYGLTLVLTRLTGVKKLAGVLAAVVLVAVAGHLLYNEDWFTKAENRNKVPQDVVTICDIFADYDSDCIRIMAPEQVAVYLRQMDSRFSMPYARYAPDIALELTNANPDVPALTEYCLANNVEFAVVLADPVVMNAYDNYGYEVFSRTNNYIIYRVKNPNWILTEYGETSGDQGLFYTMVNQNDGTLIVIDGGDAQNEDQVRQAIADNGGIVDAWILTHYHQDHIGAFNEIYADPQGIQIDALYVTPLDAETFYPLAQEWDDVEYFDRFMELTADADNINYVCRDQMLQFSDELTIKFYNAFDSIVAGNSGDVPNDDSLVFKLETPGRSALICADCHSQAIAQYLVDTYGDELQADILQCGHHGNNSMPTDTGFYELVAPSIAIFDAPDWVLYGENYTAKDLSAYLQEEGVRIVSFETAPNTFGF